MPASASSFPPEVRDELKAYVYELVDPKSGDVFYVGKGRGDRAFAHGKAALSPADPDLPPVTKLDRIREIRKGGDEVRIIIVRHGLDDSTAHEIEAVLIEQYRSDHPELLKNLVQGHGLERGRMGIDVLTSLYAAKKAPRITAPAVLLRIPQLWYPSIAPSDLYEATRGWWVMSLKRASAARYAFAVSRGIVREVYKVERWHERLDNGRRARIGFDGHPAGSEMDPWRNMSVRHLLTHGSANPVRYVNC